MPERSERNGYNDEYWRDKSILKTIKFRIITEAASRTIDLESGGVDITLGLPTTDADRIEENPDPAAPLRTGPLYSQWSARRTHGRGTRHIFSIMLSRRPSLYPFLSLRSGTKRYENGCLSLLFLYNSSCRELGILQITGR